MKVLVRLGLFALAAVRLAAAPSSAADAARPKPPYQVRIERDIAVRMRDGVTLATDLYIPLEN